MDGNDRNKYKDNEESKYSHDPKIKEQNLTLKRKQFIKMNFIRKQHISTTRTNNNEEYRRDEYHI